MGISPAWAWQASGVGSGGGQPLQQSRKADPQTPARQGAAESQALRYSVSMNQLKLHNFPSLTEMSVHTHVTQGREPSCTHQLCTCAPSYVQQWLQWTDSHPSCPQQRRVLAVGSEHPAPPVIPSSVPSLQEESPDGVCAPREPRKTGRKRMGGHARVSLNWQSASWYSWNPGFHPKHHKPGVMEPSLQHQSSRVRGRRILGYTAS